MRFHAIALLCALLAASSAHASDWPGAPFSEVRAYAYNKGGFPDLPVVKNGRLSPTVLNKRGVVLTAQQRDRLIAAVTGDRPLPQSQIMCFDPRHAFVFYDAAKKPVAWVELCFECHRADAEPQRHGQVYDVDALEKLASELRLPLIPK